MSAATLMPSPARGLAPRTQRLSALAAVLVAALPLWAAIVTAPKHTREATTAMRTVSVAAVRNDDPAVRYRFTELGRPTAAQEAALPAAYARAECSPRPATIEWGQVGNWPARATQETTCAGLPFVHWQTPPMALGGVARRQYGFRYGSFDCTSGWSANRSDVREMRVRRAADGSLIELECRLVACVDSEPVLNGDGHEIESPSCKVLALEGPRRLLVRRDGVMVREDVRAQTATVRPVIAARATLLGALSALAALGFVAFVSVWRRAHRRLSLEWQPATVLSEGVVLVHGAAVGTTEAMGPGEAVVVVRSGAKESPYREDGRQRIVELVPGTLAALTAVVEGRHRRVAGWAVALATTGLVAVTLHALR